MEAIGLFYRLYSGRLHVVNEYIKFILLLIVCCSVPVSADRLYGLERMERLDLLPYILEGTQVRQVSSHDRSGANDDGFTGAYSSLYIDENGEYVLFDEMGAGCLYRFWMTYASSPADYPDHRLRFYFDNEGAPRLDLSISEFFDGVGAPLEFPLVGPFNQSSHGCYCYLPFPYTTRLKITLSDLPQFYQITYHTYDSSDDVVSWTGTEDRSAVMAQWNNAGADPKSAVSNLAVSGNLPLAGGTTGTLFSISGEGAVQSIKLDPSPSSENMLSEVWIQMNWDGGGLEVDVPLGDFFGSGKMEIDMTSLPVGMKTAGDWYCFFPMPYWESALIQLVNKGDDPLTSLPFEIEYTTNAYDRAKTGRFNALFRENAVVGNQSDVNFIDETGRGHVVGLSLFMESSGAGGYQDMNYLEGDERVHVDDSLTPCIHGTGTEDYFNCGWYFNWGSPSLPYHGNPWKDQFNTNTPNFTQAYRMHVSDIIPFNRSVKFGIEHGHANASPGIYSSVVYYYKASGISPGLVLVADLDLDDSWTESMYDYQYPIGRLVISGAWAYVSDDDSVIEDTGYQYTGAVAEFTVPLVDNTGLLLRRRTDQGTGGQKAHVFVDDAYAGLWYEPDHNYSSTTRRWLDSEFMVSSNLVAGKTVVRLTILPLSSAGAWNEYRYRVYCIKPLSLVVDSDDDQLPDDYEMDTVASLGILDGAIDSDGDGFSDLDEYIAGTHPTNPFSYFMIHPDYSFDSSIGRLYQIQQSTNLLSNVWTTVRSDIPGTGSNLSLPIDHVNPAAFHRLQIAPP